MQTITEKILARASGKSKVVPGENIWVNVDILLTHDVCGPGTFGVFKAEFGENARVWNPERVIVIPDHYIFTSDQKAKRNIALLEEFVREQNIKFFYPPGTEKYRGVCHVALPQEGHVRPGEVIIGTDSHTCTHGAFGAFATGVGNTDAAFVLGTGKILLKVPPTICFEIEGKLPNFITAKDIILHIIGDIGVDGANYCAMEFKGEVVKTMNIEERMTLCNMAVEAGAKNGIIEPDEKVFSYVKERTSIKFEPLFSDEGCQYIEVHRYNVSKFEPVVAKPHLPSNRELARNLEDVRIDRAYIGSCTGGKLYDFFLAAIILKGRHVKVPTFLVPATTEVAEGLLNTEIDGKTLFEIFVEAGCEEIALPSCAACLGGPPDTYGRTRGSEVVISTTNRNFIGRMGSKEASIYLASPLTVAASAVTGYITDPRKFM